MTFAGLSDAEERDAPGSAMGGVDRQCKAVTSEDSSEDADLLAPNTTGLQCDLDSRLLYCSCQSRVSLPARLLTTLSVIASAVPR